MIKSERIRTGYIYTGDGRSGAAILRSISDDTVKGFFWRGHLRRGNFGTSEEISLTRIGDAVSKAECQEYGPGFARRFKGPGVTTVSSASSLGASVVVIMLAAISALLLA